MKIDAQRGAFVSQVMPKSAAGKAGVKAGDVTVTMNGKALNSFASFRADISSQPVDTKMTLGLLRDGKPVTVTVTLEQSTQLSGFRDGLYRHRRRGPQQYRA